jgi:hypothetical protein
MKKIIYVLIILLAVPPFIISCLKEDNVTDPVISEIKTFMTAKDSKDSLVTAIFHGKKIKFVVYGDADIVSIWPGGARTIMQTKYTKVDSIDMYGHPVLTKSDCYSDYGLVKAQGLTTSLQSDGGWYATYTYANAGSFDLTVVATNHGYDSPDLRRVVYEAGKITVQ